MTKFIKYLYNKYLSVNIFLQIFINIIILIIIIFVCYVFINYLYYFLGKFYFSIIILVLLCILIFTDTRILRKNKIIFLILIMFQLILYYYWDFLYIDFIKDMFWFSLILNISFIWHFLILNRFYLYLINKSANYEILRFFVSRLSYITSLSLLVIILRFLKLIFNMMGRYTTNTLMIFPKDWIYKYKWLFWLQKKNIIFIIQLLLCLMDSILFFFIKIFINYSLLLIGKKSFNLNFDRILLMMLGIFLFTLGLSIITNIPRLYFIWCFIFIYNYLMIFPVINNEFTIKKPKSNDIYNKDFIEYKIQLTWYQLPFHIEAWCPFLYTWYIKIFGETYNDYIGEIFRNWSILYNSNSYSDLHFFLNYPNYFIDNQDTFTIFTYESINIYDLFKIFWFDGNTYSARTKFAIRILYLGLIETKVYAFSNKNVTVEDFLTFKILRKYSEDILIDLIKTSIKENNLYLTVEEFKDLCLNFGDSNEYILVGVDREKEPITLFKYLFHLRSGTYVMVLRNLNKNINKKNIKI